MHWEVHISPKLTEAEYAEGKVKICTVIGFPNGYSTIDVKCFETKRAIEDGADEIDMVINIGWVKDKKYDAVLEEIKGNFAASIAGMNIDAFDKGYEYAAELLNSAN